MIIVVAKKTHDPIPAERFEKLHADATFATPDGTPTVSDLTDKSPFIKLSVVMNDFDRAHNRMLLVKSTSPFLGSHDVEIDRPLTSRGDSLLQKATLFFECGDIRPLARKSL